MARWLGLSMVGRSGGLESKKHTNEERKGGDAAPDMRRSLLNRNQKRDVACIDDEGERGVRCPK